MSKNFSIDLIQLNQTLLSYVWNGYDLFFLHGWLIAYISAPSDSEEDIIIPTYLIINEDQINNEKQFSKLVDKVVELYSQLSENIFDKNKIIRPLIDFVRPNSFEPLNFTLDHHINLLNWLYGYLSGYLALGEDIIDYTNNDKLLQEKFYPALFTLCIAFFKLSAEYQQTNVSTKYSQDIKELTLDLHSMWEREEGEASIEEVIAEAIQEIELLDIVGAINDIFYVIRVCDENRLNTLQGQSSLINKLSPLKL